MRDKNGDFGIMYFTKTNKSFSTFKKMPESYKVILNGMVEGDLMSVYSITHMYNLLKVGLKNEETGEELNLRTKNPREVFAHLIELNTRGFLERLVINDLVLEKVKKLQSFVDD